MDDTPERYLRRLEVGFHDTLVAACDVSRCVGWVPVRVSDAIGEEAARAITKEGWHHSGGVNPEVAGGGPSVPSGRLMSLV